MNDNPARKPRINIIFLFALMGLPTVIQASPQWVDYDKPISLEGTINREFDMSFVDGDMSPLTDPKEVAKAVAKAKQEHPAKDWKPHDPSPHWILHLDEPISVRSGPTDDLHPEERNIQEIDLSGNGIWKIEIPHGTLGKARFRITGRLFHSVTVHHLRTIVMDVTDVHRVKE